MAFAPKREIKSQTIRNAVKRIFVPVVIEHYPVTPVVIEHYPGIPVVIEHYPGIAVRALWETETIEDMHVAETLIASKRMQLHKALLELPQVLVSCITAMTLSQKQVIPLLNVFYY